MCKLRHNVYGQEVRTTWSGLVLGHKVWRNSFGPYTCKRDQNGILDGLGKDQARCSCFCPFMDKVFTPIVLFSPQDSS
ncbi:hypothetical protein F2Q69_00018204 [Brassica cretica]|uniref:Uncharacterized protein n=1 Tax=Brassica cretica TaxID=69181 RepID=A0A8S9QEN2_BRACR|nr:hypothetical protein F2Q69_00018204 [Brassica cretica]